MSGGLVAVLIVLIVIGGVSASVTAYFTLQRHRSDAVAMASYRKLAEQAVEHLALLRGRLDELNTKIDAVESILRSVE
jgi:hypothetical protein